MPNDPIQARPKRVAGAPPPPPGPSSTTTEAPPTDVGQSAPNQAAFEAALSARDHERVADEAQRAADATAVRGPGDPLGPIRLKRSELASPFIDLLPLGEATPEYQRSYLQTLIEKESDPAQRFAMFLQREGITPTPVRNPEVADPLEPTDQELLDFGVHIDKLTKGAQEAIERVMRDPDLDGRSRQWKLATLTDQRALQMCELAKTIEGNIRAFESRNAGVSVETSARQSQFLQDVGQVVLGFEPHDALDWLEHEALTPELRDFVHCELRRLAVHPPGHWHAKDGKVGLDELTDGRLVDGDHPEIPIRLKPTDRVQQMMKEIPVGKRAQSATRRQRSQMMAATARRTFARAGMGFVRDGRF